MRTGNKMNTALIEARKMIDMSIRLMPDVLYVAPQYYNRAFELISPTFEVCRCEYLTASWCWIKIANPNRKKEKKHEVREVQLTFDL